jgi:prepilin-type N-terminal cleavage/methylation domain-containing protein
MLSSSLHHSLRFNRGAFTLVEIIVVVAIISILVFFAAPALFTSKKESRETATDATLWTINVGLVRAYKDKDVQTQPGGILSQTPSTSAQYPDATENALAYLIERGYVR